MCTLEIKETGEVFYATSRRIYYIMVYLLRRAHRYGESITLILSDQKLRNVYNQYLFCLTFGFKLNCSSKYSY